MTHENVCLWYDDSDEDCIEKPICKQPATHYSCCVPGNNPNVCEKHKCRCQSEITLNEPEIVAKARAAISRLSLRASDSANKLPDFASWPSIASDINAAADALDELERLLRK